MKGPLPIAVFLVALLPAVHPNPTQQSCTVTDEDLALIKTAVQKASKTSLDQVLPEETLAKCPMLRTITGRLQTVAADLVRMKDSTVSADRVERLKKSFEQEVQKIVKSGDIFEKQSEAESTRTQGEMSDRIRTLQVRVTELEQKIAEQTRRMYEDVAELVFQRLQMNSTDSIRNYTKHMMDHKLDELMKKLETDYRVYLGALRFLNHLDDQNLIDKVFDGILQRLEDMKLDDGDKVRENGRYLLVNLLCWTVNNDFLGKKYEQRQMDLFRVALKFYPDKGNKTANEADVRGRQYCKARFPANVITWFAVSRLGK